MSERDVLHGSVNVLVLDPLAIGSPHACIAERVEGEGVLIYSVVVVRGIRSRGDQGAFRDERAVRQHDILHRLSCHRRYQLMRSVCNEELMSRWSTY